jgi:chromosome segregation ATPase
MIPKKPVIYENNLPYKFSKDSERADVFIKNYLMKFDMVKSLKILEQEFYELLSKKEINIEDIPNVPQAYIESEILQEKIGNIQKELDDAKIYAEKANSLFLNLQQTKESAKIKHRRVQQEKQKIIKEIDRLKVVYEKDNKAYKELTRKHWDVTKESLVLEQNLKGLSSKVENLTEQADKLKKTLEDANRQKERNYFYIMFIRNKRTD